MNKNANRSHSLYVYQPAYPNAAEPKYFTNKMLDALTTLISAMGFVTAVVFLVALA